jgi:hypothetical protein
LYEFEFLNIILNFKIYRDGRMGTPVWEQRPHMEGAVPTPPNGSASAPASDYLGAAGEDALSTFLLVSIPIATNIVQRICSFLLLGDK